MREGSIGHNRILVETRNLQKRFPVKSGFWGRVAGIGKRELVAIRGITLQIREGETLGVVGESGCGKTTLGRALLYLNPPFSGEVIFAGKNLGKLSRQELRQLRQQMQPIFQNPYASLNPRMTVKESILEPLQIYGVGTREEQEERVTYLLERVGIDPRLQDRYPHEFSGGQRQRLAIARALALQPRFIVADEPVSALDVSIQAQILNLLCSLQDEYRLTYLFISHDLSVVHYLSNRIAVMYLGEIVEIADADTLFDAPAHPYTRALLSAIPIPDPWDTTPQIVLPGNVPDPLDPPAGCPFHPRCPERIERCVQDKPTLQPVGTDHQVSCHLASSL
ncbi:MAG: ATP-binding cassette domain-containing protein [Nitrospinota bacterium]|nr:MAG: ATP-binding cassette domain-containing protein [Nitrospinota bacterium]